MGHSLGPAFGLAYNVVNLHTTQITRNLHLDASYTAKPNLTRSSSTNNRQYFGKFKGKRKTTRR
jgi:hypothetical protein